jgi:hypothetical protein
MTTFPALEAALDEAAHRHYGRRRRRRLPRLRVLVPALAVACALVALATVPDRTVAPAQEGQVAGPPVPAATLALSHALTQLPAPPKHQISDPVLAHADLPAVADALEQQTPYPPGQRDAFDWLSTAPGPTDMASINFATEVQGLVEYRAACIWLRFWLASASDGAARQAAAQVLGDVPAWPTLRAHPGNWADVPAQAAAGDVAALLAQNQAGCSPWRDRQGG